MKPLRFAVVGVGQIAQQAFFPATKLVPAEVTALFTSDPAKGEHFGVPAYPYEHFERALQDDLFDAVYVATPIFRHREFAEPALQAGKHVLLEKPMEVNVDKCAFGGSGTLMLAYRMHQDPFLLDLKENLPKIGRPRIFSSIFSHDVSKANHRGQSGFWGGPVPDIGAYPINLARNLFEAEPGRVQAIGAKSPDRTFDFHDTVSILLEFPEKRLAQISVSYAADDVDQFHIVGSKGTISSESCYRFGKDAPLHYVLNGVRKDFDPVDQFAGEIAYFIDCVRGNIQPEPDAEEGMLDVRVCDAIRLSLQSGRPELLAPYRRGKRITKDQVRRIPPAEQPSGEELFHVTPETRD